MYKYISYNKNFESYRVCGRDGLHTSRIAQIELIEQYIKNNTEVS
jgi:hypothetical protein